MGVANYENEMVNVFHNSKINLNITLRSIFTGIPLRCIDIMSSGGFLLSNYQEDLCNAFIPGEEFVYYESAKDMLDKIGYYLDHSNERMQIAENGLNRIRKDYSFMQTFQDIFDIVFP
jgi:spore maturation protein CgeB